MVLGWEGGGVRSGGTGLEREEGAAVMWRSGTGECGAMGQVNVEGWDR